jgi:hypothetical protein
VYQFKKETATGGFKDNDEHVSCKTCGRLNKKIQLQNSQSNDMLERTLKREICYISSSVFRMNSFQI